MIKRKKIKDLIFVLLIIVFSIFVYRSNILVSANKIDFESIKISITDLKENPLLEIDEWTDFKIRSQVSLPNNVVQEGDQSVLKLSDAVILSGARTFDINDKQGNLIASAEADDYSITLTYTEFVEKKSDILLDFYFYARIDDEKNNQMGEVPIFMEVNNNYVFDYVLNFVPYGLETPEPLAKCLWISNPDIPEVTIAIEVNRDGIDQGDVIIKDELVNPGIEIVEDSFTIYQGVFDTSKGNWHLTREKNVTNQYQVQFNDQLSSFTLNLGDIKATDGYLIRYQAIPNQLWSDNEIIQNKVTLNSNKIKKYEAESATVYLSCGGTGVGKKNYGTNH